MAVNNDQLKKMLDDAGVKYAEDATQVDLLALIGTALKPAPQPTDYTVVEPIDLSTEEGKEDIKNAGETVSLDANDEDVAEWLKAGRIVVAPALGSTAPSASVTPPAAATPAVVPPTPTPAAPAVNPEEVANTRSVVQAIIDQQKEEEKVKSMFDLTTQEGRWQQFLYNARKINPKRFDLQFSRGEFDNIAHTFEAPVEEKAVGSPSGKAA